MMRTGGVVETVEFRRCETAVDDLHTRRIDRNGKGNRVIGFILPHALGRHHDEFMHQRGGGDVQLGTAHHDTFIGALHDADIEIGIVLLMGAALAVTLRVGDDFGGAQIIVADIAVHPLDILGIFRIGFGDRVLHAHQCHEDAGDAADDGHFVHHLNALVQIVFAARNLEYAMGTAAGFIGIGHHLFPARITMVVIACGNRDGHTEAGMPGDIVDLFAVPIGDAAIIETGDIVFRCFQGHRFLQRYSLEELRTIRPPPSRRRKL